MADVLALIVAQLKRRGVSRAELARRAGLTAQAVTNYLNGHRQPGAAELEAMARALGLELALRRKRTKER